MLSLMEGGKKAQTHTRSLKPVDHWNFNLFDRRSEGFVSDAFALPRRLFPPSFCSHCSCWGSQVRDERLARSGGGPGSDSAAFAAPLVDRLVGSSVTHGSMVVMSELAEEAGFSAPDQHGEDFATGGCSIKRGSIFAISNSTEEAGVIVPSPFSDSNDTSLLSTDEVSLHGS